MKSNCKHCEGGIEFDPSQLEPGESRLITCPHCECETSITVPIRSVPPVLEPVVSDAEKERYKLVYFVNIILSEMYDKARNHFFGTLPAGSPEMEQAIKCLDHSYSMYDDYGKHIQHIKEKENLFEVLDQRDTYIVDTNSQSKKVYQQFPDKAFVYSSTLSREEREPTGLILDNKTCKVGNVFIVRGEPRLGRVFAHRLDEHYRHLYDMVNFRRDCKNGKFSKSQTEAAAIINTVNKKRLHNEIGISLFLEDALTQSPIGTDFINSGVSADLPPAEKLKKTIESFKRGIKNRFPQSKHHVKKSIRVAELCYCTLMMEDNQPRTDSGARFEFDLSDYPNLFGDMYIIQAAVYLGARILTKDNGVFKMASYANIECHNVPQPAKQPSGA